MNKQCNEEIDCELWNSIILIKLVMRMLLNL